MNRLTTEELATASDAAHTTQALVDKGVLTPQQQNQVLQSLWAELLARRTANSQPAITSNPSTPTEAKDTLTMNTATALEQIQAARARMTAQLQALGALSALPPLAPAGSSAEAMLQACLATQWGQAGQALNALAEAGAGAAPAQKRAELAALVEGEVVDVAAREVPDSASAPPAAASAGTGVDGSTVVKPE
jgi:hypothetical protein